jgi:Ca2+-binding EF-hand superfamily protein
MKRIHCTLWVLLLLFASGAWTAGDVWMENMTDEQFREADVNYDGQLTFEEYDNWRMRYYDVYKRRSYDIFNALDVDGDGVLCSEEIESGRSQPFLSGERVRPQPLQTY